jgi:hypothetical protein
MGRFSIIPARAMDDRRLSKPCLVVLAAIGTYGDKNGWCHPSQSTLAARLGVTRQAVGKAIAGLVELGYLEKLRQFGNDGGELSCSYRILFDAELRPEFYRSAPPATSEVAPPETSVGCTEDKELKKR